MKRLTVILATVALTALPAAASSAGAEHTTEGLIADLALILLLGAIATLVFKRLGQPVVLGYILAGFLASPNFEYLPSITTPANIEFWAELGIVVLMFTLGLEFSFKKLMNSGTSAILTAFIIIMGMTLCGFGVGRLMGFNFTNAIFLGGMLSMSSTTIILKAFTDMGLKGKKFAGLVLAVLIIEDLFAVLMLVLLSSLAVGDVSGGELALAVGKLLFYLVLWYVVGVWFLPTFFARCRRYMNGETLLVVSMGICFGMAVLSTLCGFSLELGSFIAGSILAGTIMAERIERVVQPVKDLFGAVFFISVGMMVDPHVIGEYWDTILILAVVVVAGMILFGSAGMLITGQSLKVAVESGFSLTQIGEFSFIIASLGMGLGVLKPSLYPIIVAVSVITIFTTPYFIRMAPGAYRLLAKHIPRRLLEMQEQYSARVADTPDQQGLWRGLISRYLWRLLLFSVILIAIIGCAHVYLFPFMEQVMGPSGRFIGTLITLAAMSPFLLALAMKVTNKRERVELQQRGAAGSVPLIAMSIVRYLIAVNFIIYFISTVYNFGWALLATAVLAVIYLLTGAGGLHRSYRQIEQKFLGNLNERERARTGRGNTLTGDIHQAYIEVDATTPFVGDKISDSGLRRDYGVSISEIRRGMHTLPLPDKDARILPGDTLGIIGTDEQIQHLNDDIEAYRRAVDSQPLSDCKTELLRLRLTDASPLVGLSLMEAPLRDDYHAMLVRLVGRDGEEIPLQPELRFRAEDTLWLVGDPEFMQKLITTNNK